MDFNKIFIKHVERIVKLSIEFDNLYKSFVGKTNVHEPIDAEKTIYLLTQKYLIIHGTHGKILLLFNQFMNKCAEQQDPMEDLGEVMNDDMEKMYNISMFKSVVTDVNMLINSVDVQYREVSKYFKNYVGKKQYCVVLFVDESNQNVLGKNEKLLKIKDAMERCEKAKPEHVYKIIPTQMTMGKSIPKLTFPNGTHGLDGKILQNLNIKKLPSMFIISDSTAIEIPLKLSSSTDIFTSIMDIIETL